MELIVYQRSDISHVALVGRLDAKGVELMERPFAEATSNRGLPTVVDLSGITFMTSLGIGMLFANTKLLKKAGVKLVLLNPQDMVETVLKTSKMERLMPVVYQLEEAVRSVGGDPSITSLAPGAKPESAERAASAPAAMTFAPEDVLKLKMVNQLSELEGLYAAVNRFLENHRVPYRSGYAVNLALEELIVNIIRYAYFDDGDHHIEIGLGIIGEQIIIEIRDDGRPFDPRNAPTHDVEQEDLAVGGLGLILVLDIVDSLSYRRHNDRNNVKVCIHIRPDEDGRVWSSTIAAATRA